MNVTPLKFFDYHGLIFLVVCWSTLCNSLKTATQNWPNSCCFDWSSCWFQWKNSRFYFTKAKFRKFKVGTSSRWSSSLYCPIRNLFLIGWKVHETCKSVHSLFDKSNANKVIGDQVGLTKIIIDLLSNVKSKQLMLRESGLF